jgi:hypothetical protein
LSIEQTLEEVHRDLLKTKLNWSRERSLIEALVTITRTLNAIQTEFKEHERRFAALEQDFGEHLLQHEKEETI